MSLKKIEEELNDLDKLNDSELEFTDAYQPKVERVCRVCGTKYVPPVCPFWPHDYE